MASLIQQRQLPWQRQPLDLPRNDQDRTDLAAHMQDRRKAKTATFQ
jgi:hypothetical protein